MIAAPGDRRSSSGEGDEASPARRRCSPCWPGGYASRSRNRVARRSGRPRRSPPGGSDMSSTIPDRPAAQTGYEAGSTREVGGWVIFAGVIMLVLGILDAMWGLAAVINNEVVTVGGRGGVVIWDTTAWGWAHLITGSIVATTGLALLAGQTWARWLGIFFVALN